MPHTPMPSLDVETRNYIESFAAVAIVVLRGRAVMVRDPDILPTSAQAVFWTKAEDAERVIAAGGRRRGGRADAGHQADATCEAAGAARAATQAIGKRVEAAKNDGLMHWFNAEYRRRRLAAKAARRPFPNYAQALARLRAAVAEQAAARYGDGRRARRGVDSLKALDPKWPIREADIC